jgi:hypothetical protein
MTSSLQLPKDHRPMKYALESLPELIGEQDYADLCLALGVGVTEKPTGREVAATVRGAVLKQERNLARREISPGFNALLDADHKGAADFERAHSERVSSEERLR